MQTYSGNKDEFGVTVQSGKSEKYTASLNIPKPAVDLSPKKETKKAAAPAPSEQELKVARAKAILAGNSKKRYRKSYKTSPKRSASYDAPHWSLLDNPAVDNHSGWSNPVAGLGRDLTVSQCRDLGAMPNQRRDWSDWRGTAKKAK